jgi:hypothetical protein
VAAVVVCVAGVVCVVVVCAAADDTRTSSVAVPTTIENEDCNRMFIENPRAER